MITLGTNDPESGESYLHLGVAELVSKQNYNNHYLRYSHNLVGCPETRIWVDVPSQFTSAAVTDGGNYVTVNAGVSGSVINVRSVNGGASYNLTASNVTSYTFNTSVRPLFITVTKSQYLPYTAITGGTLNTDATLWGKLNVLSTITVASGKTLTIEPGTTLRFASGASLISNGVLSAVGTSDELIKFTSLSGTTQSSWGSIVFCGTGASGSTLEYANIKYGTRVEANSNVSNITIQHCNIDTTYDGVYFNGASGSILNNVITTNSSGAGIRIEVSASATCNDNDLTKTGASRTGTGILVGSGSDADVARNDISHWNWGIGAIWSGSPDAMSSYYLERNNRVRNCNAGLMVYRLSYPVFGTPPPSNYMWNSIWGNSYNAKVGTSYPTYQSGLLAYGNYWGGYPPNTNLFQVGQSSWFYYGNYLEDDPWSGMGKTVASNDGNSAGGENVNQSPVDDIELLINGIELRLENKFTEAKDFFISFIANHPENQVAYVQLYNCYSEETSNDLKNYFSSLPKEAAKDHKLLLSYLYLKEGNVEKAKEVNNSVIEENLNTDLATKAKLNNVYIALYNEGDVNEAVAIFNDVMYKAELSTPLELNLVYQDIEIYGKTYGIETKDLTAPPKLDSYEEEIPDQEELNTTHTPGKYELLGNYPNPSNPGTNISYTLSYQSSVELVIYDIIGRVVKSFNISSQSAGYQSVVWDGKNELGNSVASGIYLYRISIKSLENSETFVKTAKLMLMK